MPLDPELLTRFHRALVDEIRRSRPEYLDRSFTVAEIYQDLVPYRTHRNVIGVAMNGDYEDALLRLLAGEGEYLVLESEAARLQLRKELESSNPNTSLYREFAAVDVRVNPALRDWVSPDLEGDTTEASATDAATEDGGEAPPREGDGQDDSRAPTADGEIEGDVAVAEEEQSVEEATVDRPRAEALERAVADTGARLWAPGATEDPGSDGPDDAHAAEGGAVEPCQWCGESLPHRPGMSYCPYCGGDVRLVPCPACGEALERSWRFCVACGTEVAAS